jgi:hypothetical protein
VSRSQRRAPAHQHPPFDLHAFLAGLEFTVFRIACTIVFLFLLYRFVRGELR